MAIIQKNIWTLFYIICFVSIIIFITIVFNLKSSIEKDFKMEQKNIVQISSNSINSIFMQYEMLLDILGHQLAKDDNYNSKEKSRIILDDLLEFNQNITAFGLARPNGDLYITSSNLKNIKNLPNLLKEIETKDTFLKTIDDDKMVIGRTYYHKILQTLIIPIRKAIRNKEGKVIAIMTAGINVNKTFKLLSNIGHDTFIFRDFDYYLQLTKSRDEYSLDTYSNPISSNTIQLIIKKIEKIENKSIDFIKNNANTISYKIKSEVTNENVLESVQYIKRYELWIVSSLEMNIINNVIYTRITRFFIIFLLAVSMIYYLFKIIDNSEKRKKQALVFQASHDYLTGLKNRYYLSTQFHKDNKIEVYSLFFIDLDNFKNINDNYGHNYGDKVLKEVSERLQSLNDGSFTLVRYSGDEFIFIVNNIDKKVIKKYAKSILKILSEPIELDNYEFKVGASIGIAKYPTDGDNIEEIKAFADIAMYQAKKEKNSYSIFENSIKDKYQRVSQIEEEIKNALKNDEIYMMYQPQVDRNGLIYGVEALVRWENKKLGFIPPDEFIKVIENSGMMNEIGEYIIKTSLDEIRTIQEETHQKFQLSINISVKQFMEKDFYKKLCKFIDNSNIDKLLITLEVTENVFIEDVEFILKLLEQLKENDIKISLDDFGTGYSSLNLLRTLPIDELKIDKSFVDEIVNDESSLSMVRSIIDIGKKFDMVVLAEGVETLQQKEILKKYGTDLFQGYYYSKPLKKDNLKNYIEKIKH